MLQLLNVQWETLPEQIFMFKGTYYTKLTLTIFRFIQACKNTNSLHVNICRRSASYITYVLYTQHHINNLLISI